jgi:hypothetical protein
MMALGDLLPAQGKIRRPATRSGIARYLIIKQFRELLALTQKPARKLNLEIDAAGFVKN